ncbi:hypothetical protein AG1IA_00529 [Rhizoctonia solani AG-1 IA]|uniref:Uncharacterized protein n=1 Tax=Thanatephorus cucumeris (strain AG1-IA) TaxID=983506 RepID=L8X5F7_THACA|nr:hypothetical protein AG1IA_00529 [Rhizoctonia solani AG-1 IA]
MTSEFMNLILLIFTTCFRRLAVASTSNNHLDSVRLVLKDESIRAATVKYLVLKLERQTNICSWRSRKGGFIVRRKSATALSLLTVPQADPVDNSNGEQLPDGEERAEMFVQEATKYYETLEGLRKAIVNLREARISSAAIAPSSVQATLLAPGVNTEGLPGGENLHYALQESLVESEAWAALAQTIEALQTQTSLGVVDSGLSGVFGVPFDGNSLLVFGVPAPQSFLPHLGPVYLRCTL